MADDTLAITRDRLIFRCYKPGDEYGICSLYERVFNTPLSINAWNWLYKDNPAGPAHVELALDGDLIVSHFAFFPVRMKFGDTLLVGSKSFCAMTHPSYRGCGIFQTITMRLLQKAKQCQIPITYSTPNPSSFKVMVGKLGYRNISGKSGVPVLIRPIGLSSLIRFVPIIRKYVDTNIISRVISPKVGELYDILFPLRGQIRNGLTIFRLESSDERLDGFWKQVQSQYSIITVRDAKYLNWRYFTRPDVKYWVWCAMERDQIQGFVVARHRKMYGLNIGFIVDLLTLRDDIGVVSALCDVVMKFFRKRSLDVVACLAQYNSFNYKIIRGNGFFEVPNIVRPRNFYFILHSNSSRFSQEFINNPRNWFLTLGDTEDG